MKITSGFLFIGSLLAASSALAIVGCGDETGGSTTTTTTSSTTTTTSSTSGGGGNGSGGGGGSAAMPELTCEYYCNSIDGAAGACAAGNDQYSDTLPDVCMKTCALYTAGDLKDTSGDTLGCRIYHASVAATSADNAKAHCPHAGPFGEGQCGDACDDFCAIALKACTGANMAFADMAECKTACMGFPKAADAEQYSVTNSSGDSFGCRAYHLTAAVLDPVTHCGHIKEMSDVCK